MNKWGAVTLLCVLLITPAAPVAAQSASLTGDWEIKLNTPKGPSTFKASIKQEGEKLSGLAWGRYGVRVSPVHGTIHGNEVMAVCTSDDIVDNNLIQITLTGRLEGDSIKGKADFGGFAVGDWSATRVAEGSRTAINKALVDSAESGAKADVSGKWRFEVETTSASSYPTFTFKQDGETLAGQCKGAFGEAPLTGAVTGNQIKFSFKVLTQGAELTITYTGTIEKDSMKGSVQFDETGSGVWIAKRQQ